MHMLVCMYLMKQARYSPDSNFLDRFIFRNFEVHRRKTNFDSADQGKDRFPEIFNRLLISCRGFCQNAEVITWGEQRKEKIATSENLVCFACTFYLGVHICTLEQEHGRKLLYKHIQKIISIRLNFKIIILINHNCAVFNFIRFSKGDPYVEY